jgi:hypothetical protein
MVVLTHLDVAHEEADGECTHEKPKASETAMQSRCTRQLESNGLNQTSPTNEPWSGSWLDLSLGLLLELLLASPMNVVGGEDGWRACSRGNRWGVKVVGMQGSSGGTLWVVRVEGRRCSF